MNESGLTEEGCVGSPESVSLEVTDVPQTPSLNIEEDNKENFTKYKQHGNASLYLDLNGEFSL